jgi:protein-L-isoaspartate O-methyltransferase
MVCSLKTERKRKALMYISPFVASPPAVVRRLLTLAELKPDEVLFDLGAGDGRPVIMAAQEFGAKAVGVELRQDLAKQALKRIYDLGLQERAKIVNNDIFKTDLRPADVVYLYLTTSANEKVRPKLETELKSGARVVSHDYEIVGWQAARIEKFCENPTLGFPTHTLYLYKR